MSSPERGASPRHAARELLVKALYQWQLAGHSIAELSAQFAAHEDFERSDRDFFGQLLAVTIENVPALDAIIARQAARGIEQLDAVGRAILLLGLAELKFRDDVPSKVVINEAVELAKSFGGTDGYKFVNGVLDKLTPQLRPWEEIRGKA